MFHKTLLRQTRKYSTKPRKARKSLYLYALGFVGGGLFAQYFPVSELFHYALNKGTPDNKDPDSVARYVANLESKLAGLKVVKKLQSDPKYVQESRDWSYFNIAKQITDASDVSITDNALKSPGGFPLRPLVFNDPAQKETVSVVFVGSKLCGYPFITHGGILATMIDELFRKNVALNGGEGELSTKSVDIKYKFPTIANNFVVVKSKVEGVENGETIVKGTIESSEGKLLVQGTTRVAHKSKGWFGF